MFFCVCLPRFSTGGSFKKIHIHNHNLRKVIHVLSRSTCLKCLYKVVMYCQVPDPAQSPGESQNQKRFPVTGDCLTVFFFNLMVFVHAGIK